MVRNHIDVFHRRYARVKDTHQSRVRHRAAVLLGVLGMCVVYKLMVREQIMADTRRHARYHRSSAESPPTTHSQFWSNTATHLKPKSRYDSRELNDTGDQIILHTVKGAACQRVCDAQPGWPDMPLYHAIDALKHENVPKAIAHHEYLKSLRSKQGWNTTTWSTTGDKRQAECNYLCTIPYAFVDSNGRVCAVNDGICFVQQDCLPAAPDVTRHRISDIPRHDKVLVISQNWGVTPYHAVMENLIKLGDVLDTLLVHKDILVHVPRQRNTSTAAVIFPPFLSSLGIDSARLVHGPVLANNLVYPRATRCGKPSVRQLMKFRQVIETSECYRRFAPDGSRTSKGILLVKRELGKPRSFVNHHELKRALALFAEATSCELREFVAPPQPRDECGIIQDMLLFKQSKTIVAPHGAGLLNLILCDPGTIIVETHTSDVNHVFTEMSLSLGLRHLSLFDRNSRIYTPMTANVSAVLDVLHDLI